MYARVTRGRVVSLRTCVYIHVYTFTYIAEWSVVRDIGEAKLHPFFFSYPSDSRDHHGHLARAIFLPLLTRNGARRARRAAPEPAR